jgi:GDP/UDP-N,N'-diacetylbacillosamine 2-epimerase (hydrolysing)
MSRRRICVVTGSRADYGLLTPLLRQLVAEPAAELQLAVTGSHLAPEFGLTCRAIEADGFEIHSRVEMLLSSDTPTGIARSMGLAVMGFADVFAASKPDLVVLLGDRYEILAAAQAAMLARLPIAHIHGGETTEGAIDEAIRHSLSKMSHLHFTSADPHRRRVIQLGEQPERVFNVGALGIDNIVGHSLLTRDELERSLEIGLQAPLFAVTYHPATLGHLGAGPAIAALLGALQRFPTASCVFSMANADPDGQVINRMIEQFVASNPGRAIAVKSLGQHRYLSLMRHADCVVGNSSSGILEAPALGVPTVNIGDRQKGRLRSASVIDCDEGEAEIIAALQRALDPAFRQIVEGAGTPYGDGKAAPRIARVLLDYPLDGLLQKRFHDLPEVPHG